MTATEVKKVFEILRQREITVLARQWDNRYLYYGKMIQSGDALKVAEALRDLRVMRAKEDLSYGEKRLCDAAMDYLTMQIAEASVEPAEKIYVMLRKVLADLDMSYESEAA